MSTQQEWKQSIELMEKKLDAQKRLYQHFENNLKILRQEQVIKEDNVYHIDFGGKLK